MFDCLFTAPYYKVCVHLADTARLFGYFCLYLVLPNVGMVYVANQ